MYPLYTVHLRVLLKSSPTSYEKKSFKNGLMSNVFPAINLTTVFPDGWLRKNIFKHPISYENYFSRIIFTIASILFFDNFGKS